MSNFLTRPNKLKAKTLEAKKLGDENRLLRMQLAVAIANAQPVEANADEPVNCDGESLRSRLNYAGQNSSGHENLLFSLNSLVISNAFKNCGLQQVHCWLDEIQRINAKSAKGIEAYIKFCMYNCELDGAEGERQDLMDQVYAELDNVDLDSLDPFCAETIKKVLGEC